MASDNGLAPTRQQVIIWSNGGGITNAYIYLRLNELIGDAMHQIRIIS